jgi:hypothetical protein
MPDEAVLREFVRLAIRRGTLPRLEPDRTLGRPGVGGLCAVCERPVTADQVEWEIQFAHDDANPGRDKYRLHLRCFAVWELERTKFD